FFIIPVAMGWGRLRIGSTHGIPATDTSRLERPDQDGSRNPAFTAGSFLRRSVILVIGRVLAGASHLLHGHLDFISNQVLPDPAIKSYLERWASIWGILKKPATFSSGTVVMTGTDGSLIPAFTLFVRNDGVQYASQADATIVGSAVNVTVQAIVAGITGDADP